MRKLCVRHTHSTTKRTQATQSIHNGVQPKMKRSTERKREEPSSFCLRCSKLDAIHFSIGRNIRLHWQRAWKQTGKCVLRMENERDG